MDATTKDRAACSEPTPQSIVGLKDGKVALTGAEAAVARLSDHMALIAECAVRGGLPYQAGGRGIDGQGVDGFGFVRLCAMAATGRTVHDLFGYPNWPQHEPDPQRVANLLEDWGMTQVGGYALQEYCRGDVVLYLGLPAPEGGPACDIVVSPGNQDRRAIVASCWAPNPPALEEMRARLQRHQVRVYRWVEA